MVWSPKQAAMPGWKTAPATPQPARRTRGTTGRARSSCTEPLNTVAEAPTETGSAGPAGQDARHPSSASAPGGAGGRGVDPRHLGGDRGHLREGDPDPG